MLSRKADRKSQKLLPFIKMVEIHDNVLTHLKAYCDFHLIAFLKLLLFTTFISGAIKLLMVENVLSSVIFRELYLM